MKGMFYFMCFLFLFSCKNKKTEKLIYPRQIGDISYDVKLDSPSFIPCNENDKIFQYHDCGHGSTNRYCRMSSSVGFYPLLTFRSHHIQKNI